MNQENVETVCEECKKGARGCVQCKKELIGKMNEFLKEIREKKHYYREHPEEVLAILKKGTEDARKVAVSTMRDVKEAMQIDYFEKENNHDE